MNKQIILKKYFEEVGFVDSNLESFNNFIENELQDIVDENREIVPTIIPHDIDEFKIKLNKIWVGQPDNSNDPKGPVITEADGSK